VRLLATLLLLLLRASPAAAAEEHAASIDELLFPFLNFLIFLYLIKRFALPLIKDYLQGRRTAIATSVREADEAKQRADALLQDYKNRLAQLNQEIGSIRDLFLDEAEKEKAKLLTEAGEIAARIKTDADLLAQQEVRQAQQELRREILIAARAAAEKLVRDDLTPADHKRMVAEFLSEVGAR
jgi:F-type H+-transporting ATPase subunit b